MQRSPPLVPRSRPTTPPLRSRFFSASALADALREGRGHGFNCHEDTPSFRTCRRPFINASDCFNLELGKLGDDDDYRRWQARMTSSVATTNILARTTQNKSSK